MLGSSQVKTHIEQSQTLDIKPRVFAEWNINSIGNPYLYGTSSAPTLSSSSVLTLSSVDSAPSPTTVNRGASTDIFDDTSCQLIIVGDKSTSASISHKEIVNGVVTLTARNNSGIEIGNVIYVNGVDEDADGTYIAISGTNGTVIKYDTGNASLNKTKRRVRPAGYVTANVGLYSTSFDLSSAPTDAVKFSMKLKSDYIYQTRENNDPDFLEEFTVTLQSIGYSGGERVYTQIYNKDFSVTSTEWTEAQISFANPDSDVDEVRLFINIESNTQYKIGLLVDELIAFSISEYEVYIQDRLPLSEVFENHRPGEALIDAGPLSIDITDSYSFPQQPTPVQMASTYAVGTFFEKVQRAVTPYANNPYSYYVSGTDSDSKKIWAIYENEKLINKIVIKINAIALKPETDQFTIKILDESGWNAIDTTGIDFTNNGTLVLYYNGTSWSDTPWANNDYPVFSSQFKTFSKTTACRGISIEVNSLEYTIPDSVLHKDPPIKNFLELVELSPRMEIDLTEYVIGFNMVKELDSQDVPLPLGRVTSNVTTIDFSSVPIIVNDSDTKLSENDDIIPISNYAYTSPFNGMLVKDVKIKLNFDLDIQNRGEGVASGKESIPASISYSERWTENENSISVECFDIIKLLQSTPCQPIYLEDKSVNEIIYSILDSVGFGDYYFDELAKLRVSKYPGDSSSSSQTVLQQTVDYFWADKNNSVADTLNDLFKAYQIAMYVDEYGVAKFTSLYDINNKYVSQIYSEDDSNVVYIQDSNDSNTKSNLISAQFQEIERPSKVILRYRQPTPSLTDFRQVRGKPSRSTTRRSRDIVWEPEKEAQVLTFFELAPPGIVTETQTRIPFNVLSASIVERAIENSGYLLIDEEIVSYDGIEYEFNIAGRDDFSRIEVIRSGADINRVISEIYQTESDAGGVNWTPTGYMVNVKRGMFGTEPKAHPVLSSGKRTGWRAREFNSAYKNVSGIEEKDGTFGASNGNIYIKSEKTSGGFFIYPSENNTVDNKRKFFARYGINEIPSSREGYLGAAIGVEIESGNIKNGLFIWTGVDNKKKDNTISVFIDQIVNGERKKVLAAKDFEFNEDLFAEDEVIEMYVSFNNAMNRLKVFIGPTSLFQKVKEAEDDDSPTVFETKSIRINKIKKSGLFGFGALQLGRGTLDALSFTRKIDPRDLNSLNINNLDDSYSRSASDASPRFSTGADSLLDSIIYNQFISGFNTYKDSFVFTGAPVARGIKLFDVDYQDYPVTSTPKIEFLGYTLDTREINNINIFGNVESE